MNSLLFGEYEYNTSKSAWRQFTGGGAPMKYFLASRCVITYNSYSSFGLYSTLNGEIGAESGFSGYTNSYTQIINGSENTGCSGVRPVVTLQSSVQLEADGTTEDDIPQWKMK